jgi:hypothetical protein
MGMSDDKRNKYLISSMLDDSITEPEMKELDQVLQSNSEAREVYRRYVDMHFSLAENAEGLVEFPALPPPEDMPLTFISLKKKLFVFQLVAALLAITLLVSLFLKKVETVTVTKEIKVNVQPEILLASITSVSADVKWRSPEKELGDKVFNEIIELEKGTISLSYHHGATVKLQGPVHFTLSNLNRSYLKHGQLAARIPEAAQGFTIDAPNAAIVDVGTEFAVNVSKLGKSQVYVYKGEVVASLLGEDGHTLLNANLLEDDSVEIDGSTIVELTEPVKFIRVNSKSEVGLNITDNYVNRVKQSRPMGYWRFEKSKSGLVRNEMSAEYEGRLTQDATVKSNVLTILKGQRGGMLIDQPLHGVNQNGYTIEMWLNPAEKGKEMALASLIEPEPVKSKNVYYHLTHIQLMSNKGRLRHKPFDFRFSHRYPATQNTGKNAFAGEAYQAGKWYHLVCVKERDSFRLYLNGVLKQRVSDVDNKDSLPYLLFIGHIDPIRPDRQFIGQLDEIAIYNRPLSTSEISGHYNAVEFKE